MNKYANASSGHGAGRIKKKKKGGTYTNLTIIFIILPSLCSNCAIFLNILCVESLHNRLNKLTDRTKVKPEQIGRSFDG